LCFWCNQKYNKFRHKNLFPKSGQLHVWADIYPSSGRTTKLEEMITAAWIWVLKLLQSKLIQYTQHTSAASGIKWRL